MRIYCWKRGKNGMRVDMLINNLIDSVNYAKRTLLLQKSFNQIKYRANERELDK